jgi:ubiquinone/menaquinone biosynthesis C-methylase UbiE
MDWVEKLFDGQFGENLRQMEADSERTEREAEFIARELELKSEHRVLDLACGYGRHALLLAGRVAQITGVDRTTGYIERARELATERGIGNASFQVADMRELSYEAEFDAAYNYFTSWGYYDWDTNFNVLRRTARALKPGGRFLLETINRDTLMRRYQQRSWTQLDDGTYELMENSFDVATGLQSNTRTYLQPGKEPETIEIRHYILSPDHLARLLKDAGFAETRVVAAPSGEEPTIDSFRIAVIGVR